MSITVKYTITISLDLMEAHCSNKCQIKYARNLINNYLKENTEYKGGWNVTKDFDKWDDPEVYYFMLYQMFAFPTTNYEEFMNYHD